MAEAKTIWVKATPRVGERVALWELDDRHPANRDGAHEAFVAGQESEPQEVFPTNKVLTKLKDEELVQVTPKGKPATNPIDPGTPPPVAPPVAVVPPANEQNGEN